MAKVIYNPPPGWTVPEPGWIPSVSWQPPEDWPPIPAQWPLFYVRRTALTSAVWLLSVAAASAGYGWLMAKAGKPLPQEAYGLVSVCVLAFIVSGRMGAFKGAPLSKWPWMPNRPAVAQHSDPIL